LNQKVKNYSRKELLILASVFHDIGKKEAVKENLFSGHEEIGAEKFKNIISRFDLAEKENEFVSILLEWHHHNMASFPWRKTKDPYKVLISEILLRKTTRNQVRKIFNYFFVKFPTVAALASENEKIIQRIITPLGMEHRRATALKKLSRTIMDIYDGKIPSGREQLLALPYVGPYTANAVLCFVYNKDYPLLDTNILRVITRVFSLTSSKKRLRDDPKMWRFASSLLPSGKAVDFNFAVLDFADSICRPKNPSCQSCPLLKICDYGYMG
jgi:A/G-specific adenine glycosylase